MDLTFSALEMEPGPWLTLDKQSITELHSQPPLEEEEGKPCALGWGVGGGWICPCRRLRRKVSPLNNFSSS